MKRLIFTVLLLSLSLNGRLVWDAQVELTKEEPRHDIYVSGGGLVVLHDRLGSERRVRFDDGGLLSQSCSPSRSLTWGPTDGTADIILTDPGPWHTTTLPSTIGTTDFTGRWVDGVEVAP